jgi:hypothetical protein
MTKFSLKERIEAFNAIEVGENIKEVAAISDE